MIRNKKTRKKEEFEREERKGKAFQILEKGKRKKFKKGSNCWGGEKDG